MTIELSSITFTPEADIVPESGEESDTQYWYR